MSELELIYNEVCHVFGVDIKNPCRKRIYINGRARYYALAKKHTKCSLAAIGDVVNTDHATVLFALSKVEKFTRKDGFKEMHHLSGELVAELFNSKYREGIDHKDRLINHLHNQIDILRKKNKRLLQINDMGEVRRDILSLPGDLLTELHESRIKPFLLMNRQRMAQY